MIVTRGLGRSNNGALVAFGFTRRKQVIPAPNQFDSGGGYQRKERRIDDDEALICILMSFLETHETSV